ncbi:MAG: hypothetical protein HN849_03935 [Victivallales bacterium]|nr:hypothetical protein [Victivallales bacterium]
MTDVTRVLLWASSALVCLACLGAPPDGGPRQANLALHRPYVMLPAPDFAPTRKGGTDATDLTDGLLTDGSKMIFSTRAVGWHCSDPVHIEVDLGKMTAIEEVSLRVQGGFGTRAENLPDLIRVHVSDDQKVYHEVDSFRFWGPEDRQRFGVPDERGGPVAFTFRFSNLRTRGRFVGLRVSGSARKLMDELTVTAGAHAAAAVRFAPGSQSGFSTRWVTPFAVREEFLLVDGLVNPVNLGMVLGTASDETPRDYSFSVEVPAGVSLLGTDGKVLADGNPVAPKAGQPANPNGTRYEFTDTISTKSAFRRDRHGAQRRFRQLLLQSDWPDGRTGELRFRIKVDGQPEREGRAGLRAIRVAPVPRAESLVTLMGPFAGSEMTTRWPGFLDVCERAGLSAVSEWAGTKVKTVGTGDSGEFLAEARRRGFKIVGCANGIHSVWRAKDGAGGCSLPDGTHAKGRGGYCPLYRGESLQAGFDLVARNVAAVQPEFVSFDIETWGWRGPLSCQECERCRSDFEKTGSTDWVAWKSQKSVELMGTLLERIRARCKTSGAPVPRVFSAYDFVVGTQFDSFWDVSRLNRELDFSSEYSLYAVYHPVHLEHLGDRIRMSRIEGKPGTHTFAYLTPGDWGHYGHRQFSWALAECFAGGASGIYFWSNRYWDSEHVVGFANVLRQIHPVQHVIARGRPDLNLTVSGEARVRGMRRADEIFLLVADYAAATAKTVEVSVDLQSACEVIDLRSGKKIAELDNQRNQLQVTLQPGAEQRLLYIRPQAKAAAPTRRQD